VVFDFLTSEEQQTSFLKTRLQQKPVELGLGTIVSEDGTVKVQTEIMAAIFCSKFPELMQNYNSIFTNLSASLKQLKEQSKLLSFLFTHMGSIVL